MTHDRDFYDCEKWLRLRGCVLRRDKYMCQLCLNKNVMTQADHVHHILPREHFPEYELCDWNLISLCFRCHNEMHNRFTGELSKQGDRLMRAKAAERNIKINAMKERVLVIGLAGCGKTTYVKNHLTHNALCYDLDAIASAFRLKQPHEEYFKPARNMANDFLKGFIAKAQDYADKIFIIRTAPKIDDIEHIQPDRLVVCEHQYIYCDMDDRKEAIKRIREAIEYCKAHNIPVDIEK